MKFNLDYITQILKQTPTVLESQIVNLDSRFLNSNEGAGTWTVSEIICHLIHCEEDDWVPRMNVILNDWNEKKFKPFDRTFGFEMAQEKTISELLNDFRELRKKNLNYLNSINIDEEKLKMKGIHPGFGEVTLSQLLTTWAVHDLSHIAQINRVLAKQFKEQVGPWIMYLPIMSK